MQIFVIEYVISAYDGSFIAGVTSSLDKAVEFLASEYAKGEERYVEDPFNRCEGHTITEHRVDRLISGADKDRDPRCRFYDAKGIEWKLRAANTGSGPAFIKVEE